MGKRGVKPGTIRKPYKKKSAKELEEERSKRISQAEILLPDFLEPGFQWTRDWSRSDLHANIYLGSFAGLTIGRMAKILRVSEQEINEAFKAFPDVKSHWDQGQEEIVTLCHVALTTRIRGMRVVETRKVEKADGGVDLTTITKELPPDIDAVKYFLSNRVPEYQEQNAASQFESRLDTMLSRIEQIDMFD